MTAQFVVPNTAMSAFARLNLGSDQKAAYPATMESIWSWVPQKTLPKKSLQIAYWLIPAVLCLMMFVLI